ncbi:MAG: imidazole glycerol phosphate synthase cyclase subunit [Gammaproteobacteria bacterium RIFCSPHIGHO2_12_FULL_38_14]|nr:MAG: imidazole glycerol phosphate synthase cyclase subunit [Gammaproteobacteria bacterium RIFCSPHIGHO2_12_FULL_38_14]
MLRKRIIFTLIYDDGYFCQSRNFRLQRVGNIHWLEKNYQFQKISFSLDELIILNATRNNKDIIKFVKSISQLRKNVFIPIAAGGGIRSIKDAELLFQNGADKIVINTILYTSPILVNALVSRYGAQSIIAAIDYKIINNAPVIYIQDGAQELETSLTDYFNYLQTLHIGEIYLNSIDKDGTGFGYDFETIHAISKNLSTPLIIAGGAGNEIHLEKGLMLENVSGVATANLFNFIGDGLPKAREKILHNGLNIAQWKTRNNQILCAS